MKKRLLCLCLALLCSALPMALASALYSADFDNYDVAYPVEGGRLYSDKDKKDGMTDDDGDWFAPSVYFVLKNVLMKVVSEFVFSPDAPMTRAMLVTVLWRYEAVY